METKFVRDGKIYDTKTATLIGDSGWIPDRLSDHPSGIKKVQYYLTQKGEYFWVSEYKRQNKQNYPVGFRVLEKAEAIDFMHADGIDVSHLATLA